MYDHVGVPNMEKGGRFYGHYDLVAISPNFYNMMQVFVDVNLSRV